MATGCVPGSGGRWALVDSVTLQMHGKQVVALGDD